MNDLLLSEKKKHDKKKNEYKVNEEKLLAQVKKLKLENQELEEQFDKVTSGKGQGVVELEDKIERLAR